MARPLLSTAHQDRLSTRQIVLKYRSGSIFDNAPAETLFAHSCNCRGVWGKGVALDFHRRYPRAYDTYRSLCDAVEARGLLGKAAVILPSEVGIPGIPMRHHHVACLFVKDTPGKPRDGKEKGEIFEATALAMQQLLDGLVEKRRLGLLFIQEIRMPRINSGIFDIDWNETTRILERLTVPDDVIYETLRTLVVYTG